MTRRNRTPGEGTRVVHAGLPGPEAGTPFLPGPVFAAPYHLPGDPHAAPYGYGRFGNPTWSAYEAAIGELEGGEALVFASGMAACTAVLSRLRPGDLLVASADGYPTVRAVATEYLAPRGVRTRFVPTGEIAEAVGGAALVWVETPANPALGVCDIAEVARAADAPVVVDNPGLASAPGAEIAARQMRRFGPVVSFDLETRERAERFLGALELVREATSFGGLHSTAERRARWDQGDDVSEGFIRLSCGCEDTADVLADVAAALALA